MMAHKMRETKLEQNCNGLVDMSAYYYLLCRFIRLFQRYSVNLY